MRSAPAPTVDPDAHERAIILGKIDEALGGYGWTNSEDVLARAKGVVEQGKQRRRLDKQFADDLAADIETLRAEIASMRATPAVDPDAKLRELREWAVENTQKDSWNVDVQYGVVEKIDRLLAAPPAPGPWPLIFRHSDGRGVYLEGVTVFDGDAFPYAIRVRLTGDMGPGSVECYTKMAAPPAPKAEGESQPSDWKERFHIGHTETAFDRSSPVMQMILALRDGLAALEKRVGGGK